MVAMSFAMHRILYVQCGLLFMSCRLCAPTFPFPPNISGPSRQKETSDTMQTDIKEQKLLRGARHSMRGCSDKLK